MKSVIALFLVLALVGVFCLRASAVGPVATAKNGAKLERAIFGMGCFWKTQYVFSKVPGVVKTTVGYTGGNLPNPSYGQVCTHATGHVETVLVEFDPNKTSYHKLLEVFWKSHDPTTIDRQGPDMGSNYRSVVFYTSDDQKKEALQFKQELEKSHQFGAPIVTAIEPAKPFYPAEEYHQNYFVKHGEVCN
jgi:methionine-S-sulfoxide reductase